MSEVRRFEALVIPTEALERGGVEVLRAAIIEGELHVTLRPTFEEPHHWGGLLSELTRRIARTYAVGGAMPEREVFVSICSAYADEANFPPEKKSKAKAKKNPVKKAARRRRKR